MNIIDNEANSFLLKTWNGIKKFDPAEIVYIEADSSGIIIRLANGQLYESPRSLKSVTDLLEGNLFYRIHRKYLVNLYFIREYTNCNQTVSLQVDGKDIKLPVSRRNRKYFISIWELMYLKINVA